MGRKIRSINRNNIVIVCEGTDTEFNYLTDLAAYVNLNYPGRFADIRIVPTAQELVVATNRNKNRKKLKGSGGNAYYVQEEENETDYEKYRKQPTRYVREAELFLKDGSYGEAWAVYDHDNFPDHKNAASHAKEVKVNIAYSSVSFEEWILAHFERNAYAFDKSVCKQNKKDIMCGSGLHPDDCHGQKCIGGRLREQSFIPDYGKTMGGLFRRLFVRHKVAVVNAAWLRALHKNENFWECNPFTNVDNLVARLLGYNQEYSWIPGGGVFDFERTSLNLSGKKIKNVGDNATVLEYEIYDCLMNRISGANTGVIEPGDFFEFQVPENGVYIGMIGRDGVKMSCI